MNRNLPNLILSLFILLLLGSPAVTPAQEEQVSMEDLQKMLQDQKNMLEQQQKLIEQQGEELAATQKAMTELQTQLDQLQAPAGQATTGGQPKTMAEVATDMPVVTAAPQETPEEVKAELLSRKDTPEKQHPEDAFPGSIPIPGSKMSAKIGGFVRLQYVDSLDPIGSDDRFIVGTIPVGETTPGQDLQGVSISAKYSRANLDMRMDSGVGTFRAFLEGDFSNDEGGDSVFRLRHAFGQFRNWILGQTWSTFMDNAAAPEELDFEGLNAYINERQPIFRWSKDLSRGRNLAVGLENPASDISGGQGKGRFADTVARINRQREWGHLQTALILRNISGAPTGDPESISSIFGWGFSLSGSNRFRKWSQQDNFKYQFNLGDGVGRYINDLSSVGGQDAVFSPDGNLKALPALGAYVAYQHYWKRDPTSFFGSTGILKDLRSTLIFGYTQVDNFDFQEDTAYRRTKRVTMNLLWSPIPEIDLGFEILWGERMNKDGERGNASQFQLAGTFFF